MAIKGIKRKNGGKKRLALFLGLFILSGLVLNSLGNVYQKKKEAQEALADMRRQKAELEERKAELAEALDKLETPEGVDFEIRKRFNVAAAGESVAIIVEEERSADLQKIEETWWGKVKNFFGQLFE